MIRLLALLLLALASCAPRATMPMSATYTIMCSGLSDEFELVSAPCCSAFALEGRIVTASHCVSEVGVGASVQVVSRDQWTRTSGVFSESTVEGIDASRDFAVLGPSPVGLTEGPLLLEGQAIKALTRSGTLCGHAGDHAGAYYVTDLDVRPGDSGSPVIDSSGQAVGMVVACLSPGNGVCVPHTGIIAGLP